MTVAVNMVEDVLRPPGFDETGRTWEDYQMLQGMEASFSVRLFPEGFSIGKPLEKEKPLPPVYEVMDLIYPYNRASEPFLHALNGGCIPGDLIDDIPCKYVDGCVACEVIDYCVNAPTSADSVSAVSSTDWIPVVYKITLRPSTQSIVKDLSLMVDKNWTYRDLMEVESRVLKTTWPALQLDPKLKANQSENNPMLLSGHKIFKHYRTRKGALLNRRLRLAASAKAMVRAGSLANSKKVSFEMVPKMFIGEDDSEIMMSGSHMTDELTELVPKIISSKLGKRECRDARGVELPLKQLEKELAIFDRSHAQADRLAVGSGHLPLTDEQQLDKLNSELPTHGCPGQVIPSPHLENSMQPTLEEPMQRKGLSSKVAEAGVEQHRDARKPQVPSLQAWQGLSPRGDKNKEELAQKKKAVPSPKLLQNTQVQELSGELSNMLSTTMPNAAVFSPSTLPSNFIQPKDKLQVQTATWPTDSFLQMQQTSSNQPLSKRRENSLPKTPTSTIAVGSPASISYSGGLASASSPNAANLPPVGVVKNELSVLVPGAPLDNINVGALLDNIAALLTVAQRHGLPAKKRKIEQLPEIKKTSPSWQLLLVALNSPAGDEIMKDSKDQRNMADSLAGGNVNARKTRYLQFQRQVIQGSHLRRVRVRLVMCERAKDAMVESVVQFGDDQDDENSVPHHFLPTMVNAFAADLFANQFCALMQKEGFELVDDHVQPNMPLTNAPMNAASNARPMPAGGSTLGNNMGQLTSQRASMGQDTPGMSAVSGPNGMPLHHPLSSGRLAAIRMPPPGNMSNQQFSGGYLGLPTGASVKPLHLDGATSQLGVLQHQQPLIQRAQQHVTPTQLAQLNQNSAHPLNSQMVANPSQLQQFLQQQQQQRQQAQASAVFQRKLLGMGSLGPMGNLGGVGIPVSGGTPGGLGSMVGLNSINNVPGMAGINNVSASVSGISSLGNVGPFPGMVAMGQTAGLSSLIGQQLRPGSLTPAQISALSSKGHLVPGRGTRPVTAANAAVRNTVENLSTLNTSNQAHMSAGLPMIGPALSRAGKAGLSQMQHAPSTSLGSPKVATSSVASLVGQPLYLNSQQLGSQQQFNLQQLNTTPQNSMPQAQLTSSEQAGGSQVPQPAPPPNSQQSKSVSPESSGNTQQQQMASQGQLNPTIQQLNPQPAASSSQQSEADSIVASPQLTPQNLASTSM